MVVAWVSPRQLAPASPKPSPRKFPSLRRFSAPTSPPSAKWKRSAFHRSAPPDIFPYRSEDLDWDDPRWKPLPFRIPSPSPQPYADEDADSSVGIVGQKVRKQESKIVETGEGGLDDWSVGNVCQKVHKAKSKILATGEGVPDCESAEADGDNMLGDGMNVSEGDIIPSSDKRQVDRALKAETELFVKSKKREWIPRQRKYRPNKEEMGRRSAERSRWMCGEDA